MSSVKRRALKMVMESIGAIHESSRGEILSGKDFIASVEKVSRAFLAQGARAKIKSLKVEAEKLGEDSTPTAFIIRLALEGDRIGREGPASSLIMPIENCARAADELSEYLARGGDAPLASMGYKWNSGVTVALQSIKVNGVGSSPRDGGSSITANWVLRFAVV